MPPKTGRSTFMGVPASQRLSYKGATQCEPHSVARREEPRRFSAQDCCVSPYHLAPRPPSRAATATATATATADRETDDYPVMVPLM
jgi:hypothetical protein